MVLKSERLSPNITKATFFGPISPLNAGAQMEYRTAQRNTSNWLKVACHGQAQHGGDNRTVSRRATTTLAD